MLLPVAMHPPALETLAADHGAEHLPALEVVQTMVEQFGPRVALACSFQKEETVLLDMLLTIDPKAPVFALDTGVLFPETYAAWRATEQRYGITIEAVSGPSLGYQAAANGEQLWETNPNLCCAIRKVEPLTRKLATVDAWIVGIRRDQSPTRAHAQKIAWDESFEIWKAAPLADWSDDAVWAELKRRLPVATAAQLFTGPAIENSIAPLRSFVAEPMRYGRLFLAGDAAHIVPPTGARGLNSAGSDIYYLYHALTAHYQKGDDAGLDGYSERALARIWKAQRFSWWLTSLLHKFPEASPYERKLQSTELDYLFSSDKALGSLAENYVGLPY